ncbi:MAG: hemolysin family protein [Paracoccaceae bacterium]
MGETTDGSSIAAHSAQIETGDPPGKPTGFWGRLLGRMPSGTSTQDNIAAVQSARGARAMVLNIQNMQDMRIEDVAIPIADIVAIADDATLKEVVTAFQVSTYTRLPVYNETLDNPVGLVHLKDVALNHGFGKRKGFDLSEVLRPLIYVPPSMPLGALLQKMQNERIHMALVIDEHGGVDGLVTIEDLIEEIVGEIADEHDVAETRLWVEESPGVFLAKARTPLVEFEVSTGVDLLPDDLDEDVDTLGGLVFMLSGRVPARGECIRDDQGHEFEVIEADARSVKRLRVRLQAKPARRTD